MSKSHLTDDLPQQQTPEDRLKGLGAQLLQFNATPTEPAEPAATTRPISSSTPRPSPTPRGKQKDKDPEDQKKQLESNTKKIAVEAVTKLLAEAATTALATEFPVLAPARELIQQEMEHQLKPGVTKAVEQGEKAAHPEMDATVEKAASQKIDSRNGMQTLFFFREKTSGPSQHQPDMTPRPQNPQPNTHPAPRNPTDRPTPRPT
jgi:hypothetical protein